MSLKKYWIETYGCQMNKAESESIIVQLSALNMISADDEYSAEIVILNTCSVRKTAEDRIWGRIGHYKYIKRIKPELILVIIGCMAERIKQELLADETVDIVIGNYEKHLTGEIVNQYHKAHKVELPTTESHYLFFKGHCSDHTTFKAFIPIMHGCNNWCSYCIVPVVRGAEISRAPEDIFAEIKLLEEKGIREITLLGQNVNSYRYTADKQDYNFTHLLQAIISRVKKIEWIRFLTSHPKDISAELIDLIAVNPILCKHIHLPVQHGSNQILQLMGRGYSRETYLTLIEKIRNKIDNISITSDIMIGFPGETEEDFELTLDLMQKVQFAESFTYKYNPREGTKACMMENSVPETIKLSRLKKIIELQRMISGQIKTKRIGDTVKVLIEDTSKKNPNELLARTENDNMVVFPGNIEDIGHFKMVKLVGLKGNTFQGVEE